ncbi:hypothetical protein FOF52_10545 [Thermobifida alba]|uniref:Uncharacterized protein n=1 Tax=Thermobifida alba TaxID=53522 RepID=A0ABY4L0X8_THEAE|nr:hypothetical protein [Thermobifida alba]UPT21342.1 hypothetical protein FOF52_10545 [Thermobifida alba]
MSDTSDPAERPPERVLEAARAAYRSRRPDTLLATPLADSAADALPGLRRGPESGPRLLAFRAAESELHLHVTARGDTCDLVGQFVPAGRFAVQLRHAGGVASHSSDPGGAFVARFVPRGPVSLVCFPVDSAGPGLTVPWTLL